MFIELLIILNLLLTIALGYFVYIQKNIVEDTKHEIVKKVRGIPKKDQKAIKEFGDAIKKDVTNIWDTINVNDKVEALSEFPSFQKLAETNKDGLGSFLSSNLIYDIVLPLLQNGGGVESLTSILTARNAGALTAGVAIFQFLKKISGQKKEASTVIAPFQQKAKQFKDTF